MTIILKFLHYRKGIRLGETLSIAVHLITKTSMCCRVINKAVTVFLSIEQPLCCLYLWPHAQISSLNHLTIYTCLWGWGWGRLQTVHWVALLLFKDSSFRKCNISSCFFILSWLLQFLHHCEEHNSCRESVPFLSGIGINRKHPKISSLG